MLRTAGGTNTARDIFVVRRRLRRPRGDLRGWCATRCWTALLVGVVVLLLAGLGAERAAAAACPSYLFLGATGSGGNGEAPTNDYMGTTVYSVFGNLQADVKESPELSGITIQPEGLGYAATGVGPSAPTSIPNLLDDIDGVGAVFHIGPLGNYHDSVHQGMENAIATVNSFVARCKSSGSKVILAGYSQGAQLMADAIEGHSDSHGNTMDTSTLVGAVFFGDPYFNPRSAADEGDFDPGRSGLLGTRPEYPSNLLFPERRIHSFCRNKDPICQGLFSSSWYSKFVGPVPDFDAKRHAAYPTEGAPASPIVTERAASELANLIRDDQATLGNPVSDPLPSGISGPLDLAFAIDTTGSMGDLIGSVKSDVTNLVSQIAALDSDYRVALVDYKDAPPYSDDPYQAQVDQGFTSDTSLFDGAVQGLSAYGGGDTPESVYTGIMTGLDLPWRSGAHKVLIAIGDAGGHPTDPVTGFTAADVVSKALSLDPVAIYGLAGHGSIEAAETFSELADETGGAELPIENAEAVPTAIKRAINESATAPLADAGGPYTAFVGSSTYLSGAASSSPLGRPLTYEWDTNGDGVTDLETQSPVVPFTWTAPYSGPVTLHVRDSEGLVGVAQTTVVVAGTDPGPPAAPSAPTLVAGDSQVTATWQAPTTGGPPSYYVLRYSVGDPAAFVLPSAGATQSVVIPELPNGVPVALDVAAVNPSGESGLSSLSNTVTPLSKAVTPPTGPKQSGSPRITGLRELRRSWRLGRQFAKVSSKGRVRTPVGTVFSFTLNEPATVSFAFSKETTGRLVGRKCQRVTRQDSGHRRCERMVRAGGFVFTAHVGRTSLAFQGRITRTATLTTGKYRVSVGATNSTGGRSPSSVLHFAVTK